MGDPGAPIVIVGAGFGGLAAAVALSLRGERVVVLEAGRAPGGKSRIVDVAGLAVSVGPTVLTMPWAFDELLAPAGKTLRDIVTIEEAEVLARHSWVDGSRLDLYSDIDRSVDAIRELAGTKEAAAYRRFVAYSEAISNVVRDPFLRGPRPTMASMVKQAIGLGLGAFTTLDAHRTMAAAIASYFDDPRLQQLFGRYATYVGSSAYAAPATFNLIAHVEREGVFRVTGGLPALAKALADVATNAGCVFRYGARVRDLELEKGRVVGVQMDTEAGSETVSARAVIANADIMSVAAGGLGKPAARSVRAVAPGKRSLSAVTFAIAAEVEGFPLSHHTVFFGESGKSEMSDIFERGVIPADPTIYICAEDRRATIEAQAATGGSVSAGPERLFAIMNAPASGDRASLEERARCETKMRERLIRAGLKLTIRAMEVATPESYELAAPGTGGALYGEAAHGAFAPLARAEARTKLPGLYLAGGSVHPGPGVPMATLSGMLAANALLKDLPSTARSTPTGTTGSTSTP